MEIPKMGDSLAEMYAELLNNRPARGRPRKFGRNAPHKLSINDPWWQYVVKRWDDNREELWRATLKNFFTSSQHIAWLVYEWHWDKKIPDDIWEYFVETVKQVKNEIREDRTHGRNWYDGKMRIYSENDHGGNNITPESFLP